MTFVKNHKGYRINCSPQATHDGDFLAFLIISHGYRFPEIDRAEALDLPCFALKGEAALAALGEAIRWIDETVGREVSGAQGKKVAMQGSSVQTDLPDAIAWHARQPNEVTGRLSRRSVERRGQFADRRQAYPTDQSLPVSHSSVA